MLAVINVLGSMLMLFSVTYLLPIVTSLIYADGLFVDFVYAAIWAASPPAPRLVLATRRHKRELRSRDGFLLVTLGWMFMSAIATVPLLIALPGLSFTDAFFETMSGLSTTGATVLTGLDTMAPSLNLWRHALNWYGGMGIIVLVVAILPMLGVGGMQLYKAETPGPVKDEKLTPRITQTARALWFVYLLITVACIVGAEARRHELVRRHLPLVRDAGAGRLLDLRRERRPLRLAGDRGRADRVHADRGDELRPALHRLAAEEPAHVRDRRRSQGDAARSSASAPLGVALYIWLHGVYPSFWTALRHAAFNLVSIATDCGFVSQDYARLADLRADGDPDAVLLLRATPAPPAAASRCSARWCCSGRPSANCSCWCIRRPSRR